MVLVWELVAPCGGDDTTTVVMVKFDALLMDSSWNQKVSWALVGVLKIGWLGTHEKKDPISFPRPRPGSWTQVKYLSGGDYRPQKDAIKP